MLSAAAGCHGFDDGGPVLRVSDSGRGMGLRDLRAWATLGEIGDRLSARGGGAGGSGGGGGGDRHGGGAGVVAGEDDTSTALATPTGGGGTAAAAGDKWLLGGLGRYDTIPTLAQCRELELALQILV